MKTVQAKVGDIITPTDANHHGGGITEGNRYYVHEVREADVAGSNRQVVFFDDNGHARAFYFESNYEVIGNLQKLKIVAPPSLKDVHGQNVIEGDYVAYAWKAGVHQHGICVYRITKISTYGVTAEGVNVVTNNSCELSLFSERALKLHNYTA